MENRRYQLTGFLAAGGMGRVFMAECLEPGKAPLKVVIKRLVAHELDNRTFVSSLRHEGEVGLMLHHPNIVRTLEVLTCPVDMCPLDQSPEHALVLEYVDRPTLTQFLHFLAAQNLALSPAACAQIVLQVADALAWAVSAPGPEGEPLRTVHRDLKPSNLIFTREGVVKVMDFGIARFDGRTMVTQFGGFKGTASYASPEQMVLGADALTPASDVFSLGLIFYQLLMGRPLLGNRDPLALLHMIPKLNARPIIMAMPEDLNALKPILHRTLRRNPLARFEDAWEVAYRLRELLPQLPGAATCEQELQALVSRCPVTEPLAVHPEMTRGALVSGWLEPSPALAQALGIGQSTVELKAVELTLDPPLEATVPDELKPPVAIPVPVETPSRAPWGVSPLLLLVLFNVALGLVMWSARNPDPTPRDTALLPTAVQGPARGTTLPQADAQFPTQMPTPEPMSTPLPGASPAASTQIERTREKPPTPVEVLRTRATPKPEPALTLEPTSTPLPVEPTEMPAPQPPPAMASKQSYWGEVTLTSIPPADIWLNGRRVSTGSGVKLRVRDGEHTVQMKTADGREQSFPIDVEPDSKRTYRWLFDLQKLQD